MIAAAIDVHAATQFQFEEYADAEATGENVRELFSVVWAHLQTCAKCRVAYAEFKAENIE